MENETENAVRLQPAYLLKVVAGLLSLGALVLAAWLPAAGGWPPAWRAAMVAGLALAALLGMALLWRLYARTDELQKVLHQRSCMLALATLALASALLGILQANDLMPPLNQFWTLGLIVAAWGFNLMLADRRYK